VAISLAIPYLPILLGLYPGPATATRRRGGLASYTEVSPPWTRHLPERAINHVASRRAVT